MFKSLCGPLIGVHHRFNNEIGKVINRPQQSKEGIHKIVAGNVHNEKR